MNQSINQSIFLFTEQEVDGGRQKNTQYRVNESLPPINKKQTKKQKHTTYRRSLKYMTITCGLCT